MIIPGLAKAVFGIVATSLIAGPMVALLTFGNYFVIALPVAPVIMVASLHFGIYVSLPASIINAALLSLLARRGYDAPQIAALSGAIIGLAIPITVPLYEPRAPIVSAVEIAARHSTGFIGFVATGVLMGLLYWAIAIWSQRRQRLTREDAASRELTRSFHDTKRARRIPWDGRVPPE